MINSKIERADIPNLELTPSRSHIPLNRSSTMLAVARENLHVSDEQKANSILNGTVDSSTPLGRKVVPLHPADEAKFVLEVNED